MVWCNPLNYAMRAVRSSVCKGAANPSGLTFRPYMWPSLDVVGPVFTSKFTLPGAYVARL